MDIYDRIAHYYDLEHSSYSGDIPMYLDFARQSGGSVLELACGSGRVAVPLAAHGYAVVGLDRSPVMLTRAKARADQIPEADARLRWVQGDMTDFQLHETFGLILIALNSFMHLTTQINQIRTLQNAQQHLGLDGLFVLDLPGPDEPWSIQEGLILDREFEDPQTGHRIQKWTQSHLDRIRQVEEIIVNYDDIDADGLVHRLTGQLSMRHVFPQELKLLLRAANLRLGALHGDYDLGPYQEGCPRTIVVARRQEA